MAGLKPLALIIAHRFFGKAFWVNGLQFSLSANLGLSS